MDEHLISHPLSYAPNSTLLTLGLDARSAAIVMRAVRNVANNGRGVVVTIHQPSIEIFEVFDYLLLLQRGGRTTYFGPLGKDSKKLINFLQQVPGGVSTDRMGIRGGG
jgi:ABC-type multidrug transport system ATPase subunit